jgi:hypothetical protein
MEQNVNFQGSVSPLHREIHTAKIMMMNMTVQIIKSTTAIDQSTNGGPGKEQPCEGREMVSPTGRRQRFFPAAADVKNLTARSELLRRELQ